MLIPWFQGDFIHMNKGCKFRLRSVRWSLCILLLSVYIHILFCKHLKLLSQAQEYWGWVDVWSDSVKGNNTNFLPGACRDLLWVKVISTIPWYEESRSSDAWIRVIFQNYYLFLSVFGPLPPVFASPDPIWWDGCEEDILLPFPNTIQKEIEMCLV